jgi:hypothetical protein
VEKENIGALVTVLPIEPSGSGAPVGSRDRTLTGGLRRYFR